MGQPAARGSASGEKGGPRDLSPPSRGRPPSASTPDAAHGQEDEPVAGLFHVVAGRLLGKGAADRLLDVGIARPRAEEGAKVDSPLAAEAGLEAAVGGHPCPVALVAEVLGHGADEADEPLLVFLAGSHVSSRAPAPPSIRAEVKPLRGEEGLHLGERHRGAAAKGHLLDEAGKGTSCPGVEDERTELVLVHPPHHHGIDSEGAKAPGGGVDPRQDPVEPGAPSGD